MLLMRRLFLRRSLRLQPRNVPLAAFFFLVGSFNVFVGLFLTIQEEVQARGSLMCLVSGPVMFSMAAYYALQERLQRIRKALYVPWLLAALATMGIAITSFSDYRVALLNVLFWILVLALIIYLARLKQRRDYRRY